MLLAVERGRGFAPGPALIAAQPIERGGADGGVKEGAILDRMLRGAKNGRTLPARCLRHRPGSSSSAGQRAARAGPSWAKQVFQSSSVSVLAISSSRSFRLRRRQMRVLSGDVKFLSLGCRFHSHSPGQRGFSGGGSRGRRKRPVARRGGAGFRPGVARERNPRGFSARALRRRHRLPARPAEWPESLGSAPNDTVLQWAPVLAAVATSGDLGFTTGPWTFKKKRPTRTPAAYGQFVSLWRWEKGKWKLLFDLGSDNPPPTGPRPELQLVDNHAPNESAADAQPVMLAHDQRYAADRARNLADGAEDKVRLYLPKKFPVIGKAEAAAALQAKRARSGHSARPRAKFRAGGDLGYAWGEYRTGEKRGSERRLPAHLAQGPGRRMEAGARSGPPSLGKKREMWNSKPHHQFPSSNAK